MARSARLAVSLALLCALGSPSRAEDLPFAEPFDHRIRSVVYRPGDVVRLAIAPGRVTLVALKPGERVADYASGFAEGWRIEPSPNIPHFFYVSAQPRSLGSDRPAIQPSPSKWRTNLTVVSDQAREYFFELVLLPSDSPTQPELTYRVAFTYPGDGLPGRAPSGGGPGGAPSLSGGAAGGRAGSYLGDLPPARPEPVVRNADYSMRVGEDSEHITPSLAYDDGRFTYLHFPGRLEMPAVFTFTSDGEETIANVTVEPEREDVLVVDRISRRFVLRLGRAVVQVENDDFDPYGVPDLYGTTVPGLERVPRGS